MIKKIILLLTICFCFQMASGQVNPTNEWINIWSDSTFLNGAPINAGDVITVFDPQGILCGSGAATQTGTYPLISVYRDDPLSTGVDEGANPGDALLFRINGVPANAMGPNAATWSAHGDVKEIHLSAASSIQYIRDLRASQAGSDILLEWSEISGATEYNIYRSTNPNFSPDLVAGSNRIAAQVTDQDGSTPGVQWTDTGIGGVQLIGDPANNYFYRVTGFAEGTTALANHPQVKYGTSGIPHVALGQIFNADLSVPTDGDIQFQANILDRPSEVLTESSTGCGYTSGYWNVAVGNFPTAWAIGDTLYVQMVNSVNGQSGSVLVEMTSSGSDQAVDVILSTLIESYPSNVAGEFDYQLITTAGTDINEIVLAMDTRYSDAPCQTAEALANQIPSCTVVYYWDAAGQGAIGHPKGLPFNDFPVYQGYPYMVNVTDDTIWTLTGAVPDTTFDLVTTPGTDVNHIAVPFSKSHLTNAESLVQDIPNGSVVYKWDAAGQGSIGHPIGLPFNNFDVYAASAYYVNITSNCGWPMAAGGAPKQSMVYKKILSGKSNIPHMVFGRLSVNNHKNIDLSQLKFKAWIKDRPDEILTENSLGAGIESDYWFVNVGNLQTAWEADEILKLEIYSDNQNIVAAGEVLLTHAGSDEAGTLEIQLNEDQSSQSSLPSTPELYHNYPNPFNHHTVIGYYLTTPEKIKLQIYDSTGRLVRSYQNHCQSSGYYTYTWDGKDNSGDAVVSGIYIYKLQLTEKTLMQKMLFVK